ncbi:unnamed protein product [Lymnaea stagnalis]|uniref:Uncharacterized protein n=1 Tax=Lymnaea stagnalis TaxID=6523 RepID=A0AAV2I642_LYMST
MVTKYFQGELTIMSGQLKTHRSVTAQVVLYIFLTLGPTLTVSENGVYEKKIYGNWQVRQNQRYCRKVLYCKFREANCTQVTTANTWTCNRINAEIAEKGCVMRICKTDLKMVCSAASPGLEYQVTSSDSCPLGEQCYVKVTPQTTTPVPLRTSPATLTPGSSTSPPAAASTTSPVSGPPVTATSSTQNGATAPTTLVPGATTAPVPGDTTTAVPEATTAPVPGDTSAAVPGATTTAVPGATAAPDATTTASSVITLQVSDAATTAAADTTTVSSLTTTTTTTTDASAIEGSGS